VLIVWTHLTRLYVHKDVYVYAYICFMYCTKVICHYFQSAQLHAHVLVHKHAHTASISPARVLLRVRCLARYLFLALTYPECRNLTILTLGRASLPLVVMACSVSVPWYVQICNNSQRSLVLNAKSPVFHTQILAVLFKQCEGMQSRRDGWGYIRES